MNATFGMSILALAGLCLCSCQQGVMRPARGGSYRIPPDAVTRLSQVDPYYRAAFRDQQAANFSRADQRKAYLAALEMARTPVPKAVPRRAVAKASKSRKKSSRRVASRRRR